MASHGDHNSNHQENSDSERENYKYEPPFQILTIEGFKKFGELLSKWAREPSIAPQNLEQFKAYLRIKEIKLGEDVIINGKIEKVKIEPMANDELFIVLPPKKYIEEVLEYMEQHTSLKAYPDLPEFYHFNNIKRMSPLELYCCRLSDYTTSLCA